MGNEISRKRISRLFSRATGTYDKAAMAQRNIAAKLAIMLDEYIQISGFVPSVGLEVGCGTGLLTRHLQRLCGTAHWTLNDIQSAGVVRALGYCPLDTEFICQDAETLDWERRFQLIASASTFQWFAAPERMVKRLAAWQQREDVLLFSTFLPDNLPEVRQLTGQGLYYPTAEQWQEWLSPYYQIRNIISEVLPLYFNTPREVLLHLKHTGVTATNSGIWTPGRLRAFCHDYQSGFSKSQGKVSLTYKPLYVLAIKR